MADTFSISIVTADGANLIAQATSSNQIVMVDALSCTLAATDAADLASKTVSWYDGISGTIESSSATDNVAKVIAKFGNAGATAQPVKSIALRAKLANQADSSAVIIAAMSDENSEIVLPSSSSVAQVERVIFNFAVNADDQTETVYADGATIADLARFVSMYKAGDPTQGEYQTILGDKSFSDDVSVGGDLAVTGESSFTDDVTIYGDASVDGQLSVDSDASFTDDVTISGYCYVKKIQMTKYQVGDPSPFIEISGAVNESWIRIEHSSIEMTDAYNQKMIEIYASGAATFGGKLTVKGDIKADNVNKIAEFYNCDVEGMLSVKALDGLAPSVSNGTLNVPIGGLVYIWSSELITIGNNIEVGDMIEVPANTCYSCKWSGLGGGTVGAFVKGSLYIPAGGYVAIMGSYMADGGTNAPILFVRIEL